jgi:hypothetical protein
VAAAVLDGNMTAKKLSASQLSSEDSLPRSSAPRCSRGEWRSEPFKRKHGTARS